MTHTPSNEEIEKLTGSSHSDPFSILGPHLIDGDDRKSLVIRALLPDAMNASIIRRGSKRRHPMQQIDSTGLFEAVFHGETTRFKYRVSVMKNGNETVCYDPYSFSPSYITDYDLYLFGQGTHYRVFDRLGAHSISIDRVAGVHFAVWAPNAVRISVVGDFNEWDGRRHQMKLLANSGVWALFIPGISEGSLYKYELKAQNGNVFLKSDPYAFYSQVRPDTSSIVYTIENKHQWNDSKWIKKKTKTDVWEEPVAVYEVHLGSWMRIATEENRFLTYTELADKLVCYVKDMGYTHIELLPIMAHPYDPSWGYQVSGFYSPTARHGRPEELMGFVDACHQNDIGVILDWVPSHFPKDAHALAWFDGTCLYEHADPRQGEHKEWGTLVFNYGKKQVTNFLIANLLFWLEKYHIDGFRVDAVASMLYLDYSREDGEWIPNRFGGNENLEAIDFLRHLNSVVYEKFPHVMMIAEESTAWPAVSKPTHLGGLGFGFKWNMGWMHDVLAYMTKNPVHRKYHHHNLTFGLLYAFNENFILPLSHDECVHGKQSLLDRMPGDHWQKFANLRLLYAFMYSHPGKKLLFMGGEFGQWNEWNYADSLDWHLLNYESHSRLKRYVRDLNHIYSSEPPLYEIDFEQTGFEWIDMNDSENSVLAFMRKGKKIQDPRNYIIVLLNFTPVPRDNYRIGVPFSGFYGEIMNSDAAIYGGSGQVLPKGGADAEKIPWHSCQYSLCLCLPPLGAMILKPASHESNTQG
jgi:1,4-alpha-glucan branching enzyme